MFGSSRTRRVLGVLACGLAATATPTAHADIVDDWNQVLLDAMRGAPMGPVHLSRASAMVHTAIFDTLNSFKPTYEAIEVYERPPSNTSRDAAVAVAAHRVIVNLFNDTPARVSQWNAALRQSLANIPDGPREDRGRAFGRRIANAVLAAHANDLVASDARAPYRFGTAPGSFVIVDPELHAAPYGYGATRVTPWVIDSATQFRPPGPAGFKRMDRLLASQAYAAQVNEVKSLGERTSTTRTAEQTEIAWFWACDRGSTYRPPGQLHEASQIIANGQGLSMIQKARLLALGSIGMTDTGICVWDCKYDTNIDLWRPESAIRNADLDNNPLTEKQADWEPLLDFTPPFPAYPSGHSSFGAVHAAICQRVFGTDDVTFTLTTDEPIVANVTRTFNKFSDAGRENGLSRIYLGVHYRFDADVSFAMGTAIGNYVYDRVARSLCDADRDDDGDVDNNDLANFNAAYFANDLAADVARNGTVNYADYSTYVTLFLNGCRTIQQTQQTP